MSTSVPAGRSVLPNRGAAIVKSVLSGDTVVLLGKPTTPGGKAPEVVFTFERVTAPRMASKANNNVDDPGAFGAREWLRSTCVGKSVGFETRKQGAAAGDRVYGLLFMPGEPRLNLAVEAVRRGHAIPKVFGAGEDQPSEAVPEGDAVAAAVAEEDPIRDYERELQAAFQEAKTARVGVHAPSPLVRKLKNAGEDFEALQLVEKARKFSQGITCVIEYVFDGSRFRCMVTDPDMQDLIYASFTLILAGVASPRLGRDVSEPFADEAKQFVEVRLLHRELKISLHGTDKAGVCVVGTVHHPRGNIAVELLKNGLARVSDWSARLLDPNDLPAFRIAENNAKRTNLKVWHAYAPPQLTGASEILGTVVEVLTGDTISVLPNGESYDSEDKLKKVSLASVRAPRVGNEKLGKADEPYANECKDRLRVLTVGKNAKVNIHYERDIPIAQTTEKRQFGTVSVLKRPDISEVLVSEGLAVTQRHRDDEEKSPRYDELVAAEAAAKAAKKGVHSETEYSKKKVNDLTEPRKAKSYSGSLIRAGNLRAVVEYVFNGSRFKLLVPSENCHIVFSIENIRCPQPTPPSNAPKGQAKAAEPFGDASKRHARLTVLQRTVEINCSGVTMGGVITGQMFIGSGAQRRDLSLEMVAAGLAMVDPRRMEYGDAPKHLVDAQTHAEKNKVGMWSIESNKKEDPTAKPIVKAKEKIVTGRLCEIRAGNHCFFRIINDEASRVIDESMKIFTTNSGTSGAPCDLKLGKVVAALFDDGSGKSWYRARVLEKKVGKAKVLFIDHGNVATVNVATHLRPLDTALSTERIPAVAKEAMLALIRVRDISHEEGIEAARMLQNLAWGKDVSVRILCIVDGKYTVILQDDSSTSINEQLVSQGVARAGKQADVDSLTSRVTDSNTITSLAADLNVAQEAARKSRSGMWRYGDIGDDDDDDEPL